MDCLGGLCYICVFWLMLNNMQIVFDVYETGNGHGCWSHKVEPMLGEKAAHGQPTAQIGKQSRFTCWTENVHVLFA